MRYSMFVINVIRNTTTEEPFYINSKKEKIFCKMTVHVKEQFAERFFKLTNVILEPEQIEPTIINLFNHSTRIGKKNPAYVNRNKSYGNNSLYFLNTHFVFVVVENNIVTVEITTDRGLN